MPSPTAHVRSSPIVGARQDGDDVLKLSVDYSEFDVHNVALQSSNYFDKGGVPSLNAREAGYYKPVEVLYVNPEDAADKLFSLETDNSLLAEFAAAGTDLSYGAWLESKLLAIRAAAAGK